MNLGDAVRDDGLFNEIYAALLKFKVLFLRDQDLDKLSSRDHEAFARRLGQLETHPMLPSHPEAPGLVQIYKTPENPADRYENAWHCDATWRESPPMGAVLRCIECPPTGGDTMWANMVLAYDSCNRCEAERQPDGQPQLHHPLPPPCRRSLAMKG